MSGPDEELNEGFDDGDVRVWLRGAWDAPPSAALRAAVLGSVAETFRERRESRRFRVAAAAAALLLAAAVGMTRFVDAREQARLTRIFGPVGVPREVRVEAEIAAARHGQAAADRVIRKYLDSVMVVSPEEAFENLNRAAERAANLAEGGSYEPDQEGVEVDGGDGGRGRGESADRQQRSIVVGRATA